MIVLPRQSPVSDGDDNMRSTVWETGEGSGTHEEEEGEILSFGKGLGCPSDIAPKPDNHVSVTDSLDSEPGAHGTIVEVGLSTDGAPVHSSDDTMCSSGCSQEHPELKKKRKFIYNN